MRLPPATRPMWPYLKTAYTLTTRAVSPATRRLSAAGGGFLPRSVAASVEQGLRAGGEMLVARQPQRLRRAMPLGDPAGHPVFAAQLEETVPRVAVAGLPDGRVMHPHAAVVSADGAMIEEFSSYFGTRRASEHPLFLHPFQRPPTFLDERVAVLATRGDGNFYHFVLDVLPKLALLDEWGFDPSQRYYAPLQTTFQRELLALAGVDLDRVIDSAAVPHIRARELVVPGLPDAHLRTPPWAVDFLRKRLRPADARVVPGRRIYVTRGSQRNNRIVRNETQLVAALEPHGFTVLDPGTLPVAEQIRAFAEAETIVAPHGAALANLAFATPGMRVVELFPPDYVQGCYWKLADAVGLDYRYAVGRGRQPRAARLGRPDLMRGVASDIEIDPEVVLAQLQESAGASSTAGAPSAGKGKA